LVGTTHIPPAISTFVIETLKLPALLVGCRAVGTGMSKPCCEYDILVLTNDIQPHKVVKLESYWAELIYVPPNPKFLKVIPECVDGIVLNDTDDLRLSSTINALINNTRRISIKPAVARKLLVSILMRYNEIDRMSLKSPIISSMLLKISAYELMQSLVYFSGLPNSPFHQLESIRTILEPNRLESEIISLALEIVGIERATASVLRRSIPSYSRLAANWYDRSLIEDKINFLYESGMTADCYYYVGRICSKFVQTFSSRWTIPFGIHTQN